jgi:prephenate dehydrogenase
MAAATATHGCPGACPSTPIPDAHILPESLGIIGLGAIGGSLAWHARDAGVPRVVGYSRAPSDTVEALKRGAITEAADTPAGAARDVALLVVAAPPDATCALLAQVGAWTRADAIVTDVASIKHPVMRAAEVHNLGGRFAGSHPLAGTHGSGFGAAGRDLLRGAVVYICPAPVAGGDQVARAVAGFWERVTAAQTVVIDAAAHDEQLAWTSHLPQAVASCLAVALAERGLGGVSFGPGARDTTRIAASDPGLWAEILVANARPVMAALDATRRELDTLRAALAAEDRRAVQAFLLRGAGFRRGLER